MIILVFNRMSNGHPRLHTNRYVELGIPTYLKTVGTYIGSVAQK